MPTDANGAARSERPPTHPQLRRIHDEFERARERLRRLADGDAARWNERPHPAHWSAAECVAHLNLASEAYLQVIDDGLARAEPLPAGSQRRYRLGPVGWLLVRTMAPPVRLRTRTSAPFVPSATVDRLAAVETFERLQDEQIRRVARAEGYAIDRVRVASSFDARVRYDLYACLCILPRHQERHLWQAERALGVGDERGRGAP